MSTNSVLEFRSRLNESPELQTELRSKSDGEIYAEDIVDLAKTNGFDFSVEDLEQTVSDGQDTELSDFELEMVSGGTFKSKGSTGGGGGGGGREAGRDDEDENQPADEPVEVSGSFLRGQKRSSIRMPKIKIRRRR